MSDDALMNRLRQANPAPTVDRADDELFQLIVRTTEPAVASASPGARRRRRRSKLRIGVLATAWILGAGVAWAGVTGALGLFESNPQGMDAAPGSLWRQDVVADSVRRASAFDIPHLGTVEFWYARSEQGGWCGAVRLPGGVWGGTADSAGGTAPGCYPRRAAINGDDPVFETSAFDYYEVQADARKSGGSYWRIYYGVVADPAAVRIADARSGRSAPVRDGAFALAIPDPAPEGTTPNRVRFVAYDGAGETVAAEARVRP